MSFVGWSIRGPPSQPQIFLSEYSMKFHCCIWVCRLMSGRFCCCQTRRQESNDVFLWRYCHRCCVLILQTFLCVVEDVPSEVCGSQIWLVLIVTASVRKPHCLPCARSALGVRVFLHKCKMNKVLWNDTDYLISTIVKINEKKLD